MIEPLLGPLGATVDRALDMLHQAFYDADPNTWGEGPVAAQTQRAMMSTVREAPKRTPEEIAEMQSRKAARYEHLRPGYLERLATAFRAYARNREAAE